MTDSSKLDVIELNASPQGWMTLLVAPIDAPRPETINDVVTAGTTMTVNPWFPLSRVQKAVVYTQLPLGKRMVVLDAPEAGPMALSALPQPFRLGIAWRHNKVAAVNMNWWPRAQLVETKSLKLHGFELTITVAPDQPNRLSGNVEGLLVD